MPQDPQNLLVHGSPLLATMAIEGIDHRQDRAPNEHFLSRAERFHYFSPEEKSCSITTTHHTIELRPYLDSGLVSSPSISSTTTESNNSCPFSTSTETLPDSHESSAISDTAATSPFLALPLEIRRTIYYYALLPSPEYRQVLRPLRAKWPNSWWGTEKMSRILRVNKQLHWETEEILYSSFEFSFLDTTPYILQGFLEVLSPRARSLMRHVSWSITMNGRIRDSILQVHIQNWKACFEVMCKEIPSLNKIALQIRFLGGLATSNMRATFVGSIMDLVSVFDNRKGVFLVSYDGASPVDKQGAEIVDDCRNIIAQQRHS